MPPLAYEKHERFCVEYCYDLNGAAAILRTHCYQRQEYDGEHYVDVAELDPEDRRDRNYASKIARRLLRYSDVWERVQELIEEKRVETRVQHQQITANLLQIADHEPDRDPTHTERLSAIEKLAKHTDYYSEDNKSKADAVTKMYKTIFETEDTLPKLQKSDDRERTITEDTAPTGG